MTENVAVSAIVSKTLQIDLDSHILGSGSYNFNTRDTLFLYSCTSILIIEYILFFPKSNLRSEKYALFSNLARIC